MDVYTADGAKLGTVAEVWVQTSTHGYLAKSRYDLADYGPIRGTAHLIGSAGDGHVQVVHHPFFAERKEWFLPFRAIQAIDRDGALVLTATVEEIEGRYLDGAEELRKIA
jgi:hypothetical protein